jgi:hypothetical protein
MLGRWAILAVVYEQSFHSSPCSLRHSTDPLERR